ncbi:MAG: YncE family protein [Gammaproteobacteria bacterium]
MAETGNALLAAYNAASAGTHLQVQCDSFDTGLRMWLIEAGVRYQAVQSASGAWHIEIVRGRSPGQGTVPGLHHLTGGCSGIIWTCERAQRVAAIECASRRILWCAEVAKKASHLVIDADARSLFVADSAADALLVIDAGNGKLHSSHSAPGRPQLPLITRDGIVCVTGGGSGTLTLLRRRAHGRFQAQILNVGIAPHDPIATQDGKFLFVPCAGEGSVVRVRLHDGRITGRFPVGDGPTHLAIHPDGSRLYVANTFAGTLTCLSIEGDLLGQAYSGRWAHVPAITPDGRWLYVANFHDDTLTLFDAGTLDRIATLDTDPYPHGLDITPDGRHVIATGFSSDCVRLYSAGQHKQLARIRVGAGSSHTCFTRGRQLAWIACSVSDHLACVDIEKQACIDVLRLPA